MRLFSALMISMFMLSSCAFMQGVADTTVEVIKTPYDWIVGDDDEMDD